MGERSERVVIDLRSDEDEEGGCTSQLTDRTVLEGMTELENSKGGPSRPICIGAKDDDDGGDSSGKKRPPAKSSDDDEDGADRFEARVGTKRARSAMGAAATTKTAAAAAEATPKSRSAGPKPGDDNDGPLSSFVPFRLLATLADEADGRSARVLRHCHTLREIIGLDGTDSRSHLGLMRFIVIANFMIDFEFLISYAPELLSVERAVVFYGVASGRGGDGHEDARRLWKNAVGDKVDFVRLVPSDPPRSDANPLPFRVPFGVHHTKLFLIGFDSCIRVVVHTANLIHSGVHLNANGAYVQDFPLKSNVRHLGMSGPGEPDGSDGSSDDDSYLQSCAFEEALVSYLSTYRYERRHLWPVFGAQKSSPQTIVEMIRMYDYNSSYAIIIPSVPGRYGTTNCPWGYLSLKRAVKDFTSVPGGDGSGDDGGADIGPVVCQFTSMGSLTSKWLHDFVCAVDARTCRSTASLRHGGSSSSSALTTMSSKLRLIWPTVEEVRTSVQGYVGGDCVPGTVKNVEKDFLRPLYHRWYANGSAGGDPTKKGKCVPHIKTYMQTSSSRGHRSVEWMVLTSHNLSRAAWGEIQNSVDGPRLFMRHWELGVFFSPRLLEDASSVCRNRSRGGCGLPFVRSSPLSMLLPGTLVRLEPFGVVRKSNASGKQDPTHIVKIPLPLPFNLYESIRYSQNDQPWVVDRRYDGRPDAYGRTSCYDC